MRHVMTDGERQALNGDLERMMEDLREITITLRACYNEKDPPVYRAEEARAAVQRLIWALKVTPAESVSAVQPDSSPGTGSPSLGRRQRRDGKFAPSEKRMLAFESGLH